MTTVTAIVRRARIVSDELRVLHVRGATVVLFDEAPAAFGNRAHEVDGGDLEAIAAVADAMRAEGRSPLLEIDASTLSGSTRAGLAAIGLEMRWVLAELHRDLAAPIPAPIAVPSSGVSVRRAREDEAEAMGVLARDAFGNPPPPLPPTDSERTRRCWAAYCRSREARVFVAEVDGAPCGVGFSLIDGDVALVDGAATLPAFRRRGCQSALLARRFDDARACGARVAITRAIEGSASQANLERAGMRQVRRIERWGVPRA